MTKIPPQNLDYEKSILAACLLFPDDRETSLDHLAHEDFYNTAHQVIFRAVKDRTRKKEPVNILTVKSYLEAHGELEKIGGAAALFEIVDCYPIPPNTKHYCRQVKALASARKLITICNDTVRACYDTGGDYEAVLDRAQKDILSVDFGGKDNFVTLEDLSMDSLDRYESVRAGTAEPGIKTGFHDLDAVTDGFKGSKFIVIAARPRIGKTALMLCLARNMALNGHRIGIFSIEMDKEELDDRFMSIETGFNTLKFTAGKGLQTKAEWDFVTNAASKKSSWKILIDDTGGLSIHELKRRSRRLKKMGVEVIFIDQLSKITGGVGRSEYEKKTDIVNQLAELKKELRMPIILLAQVNRKLEDRTNKAPALGDLKSTGSLEEDADIILLGHRPYEYDKENENPNLAFWEVAKNRGGPERTVRMRWDPKKTMFQDLQKKPKV